MKRYLLLAAASSLAAVVTLAQPAAAEAACTWRASSLPLPSGGSWGTVKATDHNGGYAGTVYVGGSGVHIVSWRSGRVTDLGRFDDAVRTDVVDENRAGTIVVNTSYGPWGATKRAFLIRGGSRVELPALPGGAHPIASAINGRGDVVGTSYNSASDRVVVRWPADRPGTVEAVPGISANATVDGIDEDGALLVGVRDPETQGTWPHVWRSGTLTRLPALKNSQKASGIDIAGGRVTGSVSGKNGPAKGVYWDRDGVPRQLSQAVEGLLINRDGLIVGAYLDPDISHGVWRFGTLETAFGTFEENVYTATVGDDGTFAGKMTRNGRSTPTVWRCT